MGVACLRVEPLVGRDESCCICSRRDEWHQPNFVEVLNDSTNVLEEVEHQLMGHRPTETHFTGSGSATSMHGLDLPHEYFVGKLAAIIPLSKDVPGDSLGKRTPYTFKSGAVYDGEWKSQQRHGFGVQKWPDGATYVGQWEECCANGRGHFKFPTGDEYFGEFKEGFMHGRGVYRSRLLSNYEGEWFEDQHHGLGVQIFPTDCSQEGAMAKYSGYVANGVRSGFGVMGWPDGAEFQGQWEYDCAHGYGIGFDSDKNVFRGFMQYAAHHGLGVMESADGRVYSGQFADGVEDGFGVLREHGITTYEGFWRSGYPHGSRKVCQAQGSMEKTQGSMNI